MLSGDGVRKLAYSLEEWQERSARGYPFQRAVERDGVSVL